jgi:hypothetical protein
MPDRYVSDTSSKCMTLTQSRWVTTWVDSCYSIIDLIGGQNNTGGAIARDTLGNYLLIEATRVGSSVSFAMMVEPNVEQEFVFDIAYVKSSPGSLLAIEDSVAGQWKTLNSIPLDTRGNIRLPFVSLLGNVRVSVTGPTQTVLTRICRKKPVQYQESYLTQVCNGDKDRYRFGFNGQEKVNEIAGVGNHNTAEFWEYDTRTARRWNVDPKPNNSWSSYLVFGNNPIFHTDIYGDSVNHSGLYEKNDKGEYRNEQRIKEFELFASTDKGKEYLLSHAQKGYKLKGLFISDLNIEALEEGTQSRGGIDIEFGLSDEMPKGAGAYTSSSFKGGVQKVVGNIKKGTNKELGARLNTRYVFPIKNNTTLWEQGEENILYGVHKMIHEVFLHGKLHAKRYNNNSMILNMDDHNLGVVERSEFKINGWNIFNQAQMKLSNKTIINIKNFDFMFNLGIGNSNPYIGKTPKQVKDENNSEK